MKIKNVIVVAGALATLCGISFYANSAERVTFTEQDVQNMLQCTQATSVISENIDVNGKVNPKIYNIFADILQVSQQMSHNVLDNILIPSYNDNVTKRTKGSVLLKHRLDLLYVSQCAVESVLNNGSHVVLNPQENQPT